MFQDKRAITVDAIGTRPASDCCNSATPKSVVCCVDTTGVLGWHIKLIIYRLRWLLTHSRLHHGLRESITPSHSYGLHLVSAQLSPKTGKTIFCSDRRAHLAEVLEESWEQDVSARSIIPIITPCTKKPGTVAWLRLNRNSLDLKPPPETVVPVVGLEPTRLFKVPGF
jgi:hypothetical protein